MNFKQLLNIQVGMGRMGYLIIGSCLLVIKYNIDRLIAHSFGRHWYFYDYFYSTESYLSGGLNPDETNFLYALLLTAIPFIIVGTILTLKRLHDAGLPGWLVSFFFLPYVNILTFITLCAIPTKILYDNFSNKPTFLKRVIPESKLGSALMAIFISVIFSVLLTIIAIDYFAEYGWGMFIGIPFFSGLATVLLASYHKQVSLQRSIYLAFITTAVFSVALLAFAIEGIICLMMAAPLGLLITALGSIIGYSIQRNIYRPPVSPAGGLLLFIPFLMLAENSYEKNLSVHRLETSISVDAEPAIVWNHLVGFSKIDPPQELLFKAGISYPTHATITGKGVGALRECHFTTGTFVEPITVWNEPVQLSFDVLQQPVPMTELSFYQNLETPHLHGYFHSEKGEFRLSRLANGKTQLTGTTWYQNSLWPGFYWKWWTDEILHKIHFRVLNHIKAESEKLNVSNSRNPD